MTDYPRLTYMPSLPADLRDDLERFAATNQTGVAKCYSDSAQMLLVAQIAEGALIGWTIQHPISRADAQQYLDTAPDGTPPPTRH